MRGGIDFEGIRTYDNGVTYFADAALKTAAGDGISVQNRAAVIGKAVAVVADSTVGYGADGDALLGAIKQYEYDGIVSVDDAGYVILPAVTSGTTPRLPQVGEVVVCNGAGAVRHDEALKYGPTVVSVDATANTVVVRLA